MSIEKRLAALEAITKKDSQLAKVIIYEAGSEPELPATGRHGVVVMLPNNHRDNTPEEATDHEH